MVSSLDDYIRWSPSYQPVLVQKAISLLSNESLSPKELFDFFLEIVFLSLIDHMQVYFRIVSTLIVLLVRSITEQLCICQAI